jgi:Holliday junction DNA helicase RuvB
VHNDAMAEDRRLIDAAFVERTLDRLGIDDRGLVRIQRRYLALLGSRRRAVGLQQAARLLGVDARTLERDHEPYLLRLGLIDVTPNGRVATAGSGAASLRLVRHPAWTGPAAGA